MGSVDNTPHFAARSGAGVVNTLEAAAASLESGSRSVVMALKNLLKNPAQSLFKSLPEALSGVIRSISPQQRARCANAPLPFSVQASGISQEIVDNPLGALQNLPRSSGPGADSPPAGSEVQSQANTKLEAGQQESASGQNALSAEELQQAQRAKELATALVNKAGQLNLEAKRSSKIT